MKKEKINDLKELSDNFGIPLTDVIKYYELFKLNASFYLDKDADCLFNSMIKIKMCLGLSDNSLEDFVNIVKNTFINGKINDRDLLLFSGLLPGFKTSFIKFRDEEIFICIRNIFFDLETTYGIDKIEKIDTFSSCLQRFKNSIVYEILHKMVY